MRACWSCDTDPKTAGPCFGPMENRCPVDSVTVVSDSMKNKGLTEKKKSNIAMKLFLTDQFELHEGGKKETSNG